MSRRARCVGIAILALVHGVAFGHPDFEVRLAAVNASIAAAPGSLGSSATAPALVTDHVVTVSGLSPATHYYYSVGSTAAVLAGNDLGYAFTTPPPAGTAKAFRTWVLGDSGTANADAARVRDAYLAFTGARGPTT